MRPFTARSVLLLVLLAAPVPAVNAAPVVFDNTDARFAWPTEVVGDSGTSPRPGAGLDVTRGPGEQPTGSSGGGRGTFWFSQSSFSTCSLRLCWQHNFWSITTRGPAALAVDRAPGSTPPPHPVALSSTGVVGPDHHFHDHALAREAHFSPAFGGGVTRHFPDHGFVGTRVTLDDGVHYGFIELQLDWANATHTARPLRWGYESEAGVPFPMSAVVPEPAAAAVLAGCATALSARRPRRRRALGATPVPPSAAARRHPKGR